MSHSLRPPWTAAHQAPLSSTISWNLLKFMPTELVMPSNHLILCHYLLLLPSTFPSIRIFSMEKGLGDHFSPAPGALWASQVAQMVKCLPAMWETQVRSLHQEDPLRRKWQPTPVLLPGESHGGRSLVGYSPWGHKELDTTERLHFLFFGELLPACNMSTPILLETWR